jgi:hypothetical protein
MIVIYITVESSMRRRNVMSPIKKVFLIIGTLVLAFIIWGLVFNDGGIIRTAYDAVQKPINATYSKMVGDKDAKLMPDWLSTVVNNDDLTKQNSSW